MLHNPPRRAVMLALPAAALVTLAGCQQGTGLSLTEAIRRLLTLSSQRAFAQLLRPGGFYDSQVARLSLPPQLGGPGQAASRAWCWAAPCSATG